jgi:hypothetical protein
VSVRLAFDAWLLRAELDDSLPEVAAARALADVLDIEPGSPALWREYREMLRVLRSLMPVDARLRDPGL